MLKSWFVDPNLKSEYGDLALVEVAKEGHIQIVQMLLKAPGIDSNLRNNDGYSILEQATKSQNKEMVKILKQYNRLPPSLVSINQDSAPKKMQELIKLLQDSEQKLKNIAYNPGSLNSNELEDAYNYTYNNTKVHNYFLYSVSHLTTMISAYRVLSSDLLTVYSDNMLSKALGLAGNIPTIGIAFTAAEKAVTLKRAWNIRSAANKINEFLYPRTRN